MLNPNADINVYVNMRSSKLKTYFLIFFILVCFFALPFPLNFKSGQSKNVE